MPEIHITKVPEIRWCRKPPYSAVDQLRLIGSLKGVNTMSQLEENDVWTVGTCLSGPRGWVAQNQKMSTLTKRRAPMPKPARV